MLMTIGSVRFMDKDRAEFDKKVRDFKAMLKRNEGEITFSAPFHCNDFSEVSLGFRAPEEVTNTINFLYN